MNLASVLLQAEGRIDPEAVDRVRAEAGQHQVDAEVVLREWDARTHRLVVIWEGPMRRDHIAQLAAGRSALGTP